jgi:hypothetical protein
VRWIAGIYDRSEDDMLRLENAEPRLGGVSGTPRYANAVSGSSRGAELTLQRSDLNGRSGWISYAYGRARYDDAITGESYWGDYDQRHTVNVFGQYRLSGRTRLSIKFRRGSNVPVAGYFSERDGGLYLSAHPLCRSSQCAESRERRPRRRVRPPSDSGSHRLRREAVSHPACGRHPD